MADRRRRTPWFPRSMPPVHHGVYECAVMITSRAPLFKWELEWDGKGFLTPCPMVVRKWRGLVKRPAVVGVTDHQTFCDKPPTT